MTARSVNPTIYLETFGCQMNELDSELVRGQLCALGYRYTSSFDEADIVMYNTCSVREHAEQKVYSRIGIVGKQKQAGRHVVLGVIGCMAERDGVDMLRRYPQIDLLCGPGELDKLPMLLDNVTRSESLQRADRAALQGNRSRRSATLSAAEDNLELLDLSRAFDPDHATSRSRSAYVRITRGCNKFCTYCVVPNTRGAEVHRPPDHIVDECKRLADQGVIEITLLGQTVNHYVYVHGPAVTVDGLEVPQIGPGLGFFRKNGASSPAASPAERRTTTFADLLLRIHQEVPEIQRLRFVTSYPRDFSDQALQVMRDCPRICRYLHVPAQSGSDRILKLMNRGYTVGEYLDFIDRARAMVPDVSLAGDIIVGFPTETDEDFELTKLLVRRVRFKNHFIFKYSPRPGTAAIDRLPDDVPEAVKKRRNNELLSLQAEISTSVHAEQVGLIVDVMIEGVGRQEAKPAGNVEIRWEAPRGDIQLIGRTNGDLIVSVAAPSQACVDDLIGSIQPVEITGSGALILFGRLWEAPVDAGSSFGRETSSPTATWASRLR